MDPIVLRTGRLYEADMAAEALTSAGIPFYRRTVNIAGLEEAMPFQPSPGPGEEWLIRVLPEHYEAAKEVIVSLHIDDLEAPSVWHGITASNGKRWFKLWAIFALLVTFGSLLWQFVEALLK